MTSKPSAHIENWRVAVVAGRPVLVGKVIKHPRLDKFTTDVQMTSPLVSINFTAKIAETVNTRYTLGREAV